MYGQNVIWFEKKVFEFFDRKSFEYAYKRRNSTQIIKKTFLTCFMMIENLKKNSKKKLRGVGNEPTTSRTTTGALHRCATRDVYYWVKRT